MENEVIFLMRKIICLYDEENDPIGKNNDAGDIV